MINITDIFNKFYDAITNAQKLLVSKKQLTNFYKLKNLTGSCKITAGPDWTINGKLIRLSGNTLVTWISASPKVNVGAGAITNQVICTIEIPVSVSYPGPIQDNPPFLDFYQSSGNTAVTGGIAMFRTASSTIGDSWLTYDVSITATHAAISAGSTITCTLTSLVTFKPASIMNYLDSI